MNFKLFDIEAATGGKIKGDVGATLCSGVGIDTRAIKRGDLFVAIEGAHFDGHKFLIEAMNSGAKACLVKKGNDVPKGMAAIEVEDTVKALGDIAKWWRAKFSYPCVAITGSNGKSTTKEMTAAAIHSLGKVLKTEGNFNNLIGLPLTVFRMENDFSAAILEMGMNAPGEIKRLTEVASPTVGLITNVTAAHLEKLHTVEAVALAKGELFETMNETAVVVVNGEDKLVRELAKKRKGPKIVFGMQNGFDVQFLHMETSNLESTDLKISVRGKELNLRLPVPGIHNVMNALAALSVASALGIDPALAADGLVNFRPMGMRFERVQLSNGVCVVNDSYNANPESMKAAFRTVASAKRAGRFIAVLGDMLELGEASDSLHFHIGEAAAKMGVDKIYVTGNFADSVALGAASAGLDSKMILVCNGGAQQISDYLINDMKAGDILLIKGSRGMKMERIVEKLKEVIGTD